MRHFFQIMTVVIMAAIMVIGTSAQVGTVATVNQELTLRVGAGTEWRIITYMPVGTAVALDGRNSPADWVRGITDQGEVGWMYAPYLDVSQGAVNALPVIAREAPLQVSAPAAGAQPSSGGAPAQSSDNGNNSGTTAGTTSGGTVTTATAALNMRSGPSTDYRRVGGVDANAQIRLDGRDGTLSWVRGINNQGDVGWVAARFTTLDYNQLAALPVVGVDTPFNLAAPGGSASQPAAEPDTVTAPSAAPITSTAPVRGFAYGGHVRGLSDTTVNAMRRAGMTWVKYQVRYNQGDNPDGLIGLINDAHAKGFRVLLGVVGSPAQLNNGGYNDAYAGFVGGLARNGADAIEIWNEPNLDREWPTGQINAGMYTQLLAAAYNSIKANNSNTLVISGAPAPTGAEAAFPGRVVNDDNYLRGMVAAGALNYLDCVGAHYNEGIVSPNQNFGDPRSEYYTRYYDGMVNTYTAITGGRKPICFTELGYLTPEGFPPLPPSFDWAANVSVAQQASWLDTVMAKAANNPNVRLVIVWNVDFKQYDADPMAGFAIIRPDGSCPACAALGN